MDGICTLANDRVFDQLVALLNSIEAIAGSKMPICVYPYDDNTERIAREIDRRPNVQLYRDRESMERWDRFARAAWDNHPTARQRWQQVGSTGYHRFGTHRRYCAFDGPFDRFLYMDADTLLLGPTDFIFDRLDENDCIVYDFQHKDPAHIYELTSPKLTQIFPQERIDTEIFCSGFYASKKDLFSAERQDWLIEKLVAGEAEIVYPMAVDQPLLNYMMMRSSQKIYNFALQLPPDKQTGCCITSPHFQAKDRLLYDKGNRLTYLHYIGLSSQLFAKLCAGENIVFPYREFFLHYRYLHEPSECPQLKGKPKPYNAPPSLAARVMKKLGLNS